MSEVKKSKMTTFTWFAVFICGLGSTATGAQSIIKNFYVIYKEANMLTDGQMGTILSITSIAQVLSYFYGGIISDIVKPRTMLTFACSSYFICSVILATNPRYLASIVIILFIPWTPAYYIFAVGAVLLLASSLKGRSPLSNTLLTTVRTPMMLFSTSVAFESMVMTIPDTFAYSMAGNAIEKYGMAGYKYIFIISIALVLGGLVCNIILDRRMKAGKDSTWFFAKHGTEATA